MYYNIKPVNDENTCLGCFKKKHFSELNSRLLRDGEIVLTVKDCEKLVKLIDEYSSLDDLDIDCLYGCLEWAIDKDTDICIKVSDTPFK